MHSKAQEGSQASLCTDHLLEVEELHKTLQHYLLKYQLQQQPMFKPWKC